MSTREPRIFPRRRIAKDPNAAERECRRHFADLTQKAAWARRHAASDATVGTQPDSISKADAVVRECS